jgi:hypothetical protein
MPKRDVAKSKTRKALRRLKRVADSAEQGEAKLSDWEKEFVAGVSGRLEKYGSAFRDPSKGKLEEALSQRQANVARVLEKKSGKAKAADSANPEGEKKPDPPKPRSSFKRKVPARTARGRDINEDLMEEETNPPSPETRRARLRVVPGQEKP